MKSWKKPTPEEVASAVALLSHAEQYRYFFDKLENPRWIAPLSAKGFFLKPPELIRDDPTGPLRFLPWPESRYLARMAKIAGDEVLEVILRIPNTDNVLVQEDLIDAALAMPAALAVKLLPVAKPWVHSRFLLYLPEKIAALAVQINREGYEHEALDLMRSLMALAHKEEATSAAGHEDDPSELLVGPTARFDPWKYGEICRKYVPELISVGGVGTLFLFCDLLEDAMRAPTGRKNIGTDAYCYIWRPAIEDHGQNLIHDAKNALVSCVRDALEAMGKNDPSEVSLLVDTLEKRQLCIFQRLSLHLIRTCFPGSMDLAAPRIANRDLFTDIRVRHEYALLAQQSFGKLDGKSQNLVFGWIEQGPDVDQYKTSFEQMAGEAPSTEQIAGYKRAWERDRLAFLGPNLPDAWKLRYDRIVAEIGEPQHPEFSSYTSGGFVGPSSPKTRDELLAMTVEQIVIFLKAWQPTSAFTGPTPDGMGRTLQASAAEEPERFALRATLFQELEPTYVRAAIMGFHDAVRLRKRLPWEPVLELCYWVTNQKDSQSDTGSQLGIDRDPNWSWTRQAVAWLLREGLGQNAVEIPIALRSTVWKVLLPLTHDKNPTLEHERHYGGTNMDPSTLSINTIRGSAMHALIQYALWIRRQFESEPNSGERIAKGFQEMQEVRDVLDRHLDPAFDSSVAVRSVYGQWYPWLALLDRRWAADNVSRIFPTNDTRIFWPSWEAYLAYCQPFHGVTELLHECYAYSIRHPNTENYQHAAYPDQQLAQHMMILTSDLV